MKDKLDTLKPGAPADLIVVNGDPFRDPGLFQEQGRHLWPIMKGGEFYKPPVGQTRSGSDVSRHRCRFDGIS